MKEISPYYESIEFNVSTGSTDYDVDDQQVTFLAVVGPTGPTRDYPTFMEFRTNNTVSIKLNSTTNHAITIASTDSPYKVEGVEIRNVFITNNSGNTAAVKIRTQHNPN